MLVANEARIIPAEAKSPPTTITGRQPNLFTSTLHRGPWKHTTRIHTLEAIKSGVLRRSPRSWGGVTCAVEHGEQNGGDPRRVAVANPKLLNQLLEENADGLGESVGEAGDDKAAGQHGPAPSTVRGLHSGSSVVNHGSTHDAFCWNNKNHNRPFIATTSTGRKSFHSIVICFGHIFTLIVQTSLQMLHLLSRFCSQNQ